MAGNTWLYDPISRFTELVITEQHPTPLNKMEFLKGATDT